MVNLTAAPRELAVIALAIKGTGDDFDAIDGADTAHRFDSVHGKLLVPGLHNDSIVGSEPGLFGIVP